MKKPEMKTKILSGNVEILDRHPTPYSTIVKVDGKIFSKAWIIKSFTYHVDVQTGERKLELKYFEKGK